MATNSYFGQLFLDVSARIQQQVPEIKWIDQDFGQLELFEDRPTVVFPCVLIDFPMAQYSNVANSGQMGDITVQIRMGFSPFSKSHAGASTTVREKALEYYAIEQKVFEALQGFETPYTAPFSRVAAGTEQRMSANDLADRSGLRVRVLNFATGYDDLSALPQFVQIPAGLAIEQQIQL